MSDRFAARRKKLLPKIKSAEVQALLVSYESNVTYLTGFTGDSSYLLVGDGVCVLISDGRYTTQISQECPGLDVYIRTQKETIVDAAAKVAKQAKLGSLGIEGDHFTVSQAEKLLGLCKGLESVPLSGLVEELRQVKDAEEIDEICKAVRLAEKGFEVLRAELRGELTELQVAHNLEHTMRQFGAQGAAFETIVAVGPRAALPHARPTEVQIDASDFVLVDWGACSLGGYRSDLTRVLATGTISPKLEKVYGVVLKAQQAAIRAIRPGVKCSTVDAVARRVIHKAGFGKHFNHGLGHGIGIDIHEGPRFSVVCDIELKPGMVMTVEPGIYLEGWGGVRIEDDILVTKTGCEVLTSAPKDFDHILVR